jgi:hypothetical protein
MIYIAMALGLILLVVGVRDAGSTLLTCQRLEPGQINCRQEKYIWSGWVKLSEFKFDRVLGVKIRRVNGNTTYLLLDTATGEMPLYDFGPAHLSDLDTFINSTEPLLLLRQSRWATLLVEWFAGGLLLVAGRLSLWIFNEGGSDIVFRRIHQSMDRR